MSKSLSRIRIGRLLAGVLLVCVALLAACEDEVAPGPVPVDIEIVSGDGQYSKQGTELEDPVVVQVVLSDGEVAIGVPVRFAVRSGGGTLSRTTANTNSSGQTSVRWTLGPGLGTQELTIELADDGEVETVAEATSAVFFCPEEDPTFARRFFAENDIFLFTRKSTVIAGSGPERAGVVQLEMDLLNLEFGAASLVGFDETFIQAIVRDCAFSESGEFFIAWTNTSSVREIAKIAPDRSVTHIATLEGILGTEITTMEGAVLAGCDEFGPFTIGCRDTLTRYADATFDGTISLANSDAVAYDNIGNYLYFIDETGRRLRRVPLDGFTQTGPTEEVAILTADEATGANGMVVAAGDVYILVESTATKSIVRVTAGVKATVLDFIAERGAGAAAGIQSDLALLDNPPALFTLDTLNNVMLIYVINEDRLEVIVPEGIGNEGAASNGSSGERVGLAVLP